jgi:hypothetical protein
MSLAIQVLLFCMYTCQIINKTQTIFEIDSGHFYCITKVHAINKDYQVIINSFDNFMFQYIINYSHTCVKRSTLGQIKSGLLKQVTS